MRETVGAPELAWLMKTRHCKTHGEYEVPLVSGRFLSTCPECLKEHDAHIAAEEAERKKAGRIRMLQAAGVPRRFHNKGLNDYHATTRPQKEALAFAQGFWSDGCPGRSAVFAGRPGTGKTHLAMGIIAIGLSLSRSVQYTTAGNIIRAVKGSWRTNAERGEDQILHDLISRDLLVIDEVGVQHGTRFEQNLLFDIINGRYDNISSTILISNENLDGIKKYLGERIIDRLREDGGRLFVFNWESARGRVSVGS